MKKTKYTHRLWTAATLLLFVVLGIFISCGEKDDPVDIKFSATVRGTVTDKDDDNKPLSAVNIEVVKNGNVQTSVTTKTDGVYSLTLSQLSGNETFSVKATKSGYKDLEKSVTFNSGDNNKQTDFVMERLAPELSVNPEKLDFVEGGSLSSSVTLENTGGGLLSFTIELPSSDPWISVDKTSGEIAAGQTSSIAITVDPKQTVDGENSGSVIVNFDNGSKTIPITYRSNAIPAGGSISVTPDKSAYLMRESINFEASGWTDTDGDDLLYKWDFGDSSTGPFTEFSESNGSPDHKYETAGSYTVTLTVKDENDGVAPSVTHSIEISANTVPTGGNISFDPASGPYYVNSSITFKSATSDWNDDQTAELEQLQFKWEFTLPDGSVETSGEYSTANQNYSRSFSAAGKVDVNVKALDKDGGESEAKTSSITISAVGQPVVTTLSVNSQDVTHNSVKLSGTLDALGGGATSLSDHGFVYAEKSVTETPDVNNSKVSLGTISDVGGFEALVSGLDASTTYFVRSYAVNGSGLVEYGNAVSFKTTLPHAPLSVEVKAVQDVTQTTLKALGAVNNAGLGVTIAEYGFVIGTTGDPTLDNKIIDEKVSGTISGDFSIDIDGVEAGKSYKIRAYFKTSDDTVAYSNTLDFQTLN